MNVYRTVYGVLDRAVFVPSVGSAPRHEFEMPFRDIPSTEVGVPPLAAQFVEEGYSTTCLFNLEEDLMYCAFSKAVCSMWSQANGVWTQPAEIQPTFVGTHVACTKSGSSIYVFGGKDRSSQI